jgi:hypothetical protein
MTAAEKRTIPKSGVLPGKISEHNGFVPSLKNTLRHLPLSRPQVDIKTFGLYALLQYAPHSRNPFPQTAFGPERAQALPAFAMFGWTCQAPIKRALAYRAGISGKPCGILCGGDGLSGTTGMNGRGKARRHIRVNAECGRGGGLSGKAGKPS